MSVTSEHKAVARNHTFDFFGRISVVFMENKIKNTATVSSFHVKSSAKQYISSGGAAYL